MQKIYLPEELNSFSRETLVAVLLSMQDQLTQLNTNMERLIEQIASANNHRYGRSCEKLDVIAGQLELEIIFNEAEALTETLYVVEPAEEDVIQVTRRKKKGKREANLKELPVEVISHTLPEEKLQEIFGSVGWKQLPDEVYKRVRVQPAVYTVEEHTVSMCCRPMRLWSGYRRMGDRQTARVTCGFTGRERDMGIHPLSCMNTRRPGKQTIRGNS